jgi:uncharacterized membrane protein
MNNTQDLEHLRWLRIGYFINAGIMFLVALFPVIHLVIGVMMVAGSFDSGKDSPPAFVGFLFIGVALVIMTGAAAMAVCNLLVANYLAAQRRWIFCIVIAALNLMFSPVGIVVGVFTFIVLLRDSVKQLFDRSVQPISGNMPDWR